jgi:hypothetical protein
MKILLPIFIACVLTATACASLSLQNDAYKMHVNDDGSPLKEGKKPGYSALNSP